MFDRFPQRVKLDKFRLGTISEIQVREWPECIIHCHLAVSREIPSLGTNRYPVTAGAIGMGFTQLLLRWFAPGDLNNLSQCTLQAFICRK